MKCEKLDVWKKSARLSADVYKAFAQSRDFGFRDQITRAGLSIPSNIAEGMEKESSKEQIRYLDIAKGSAAEFATQVYIGMDIGYIDRKEGRDWINGTDHILAMLTRLQQKIRNTEHITRNTNNKEEK
jgi:four helix bundle protein